MIHNSYPEDTMGSHFGEKQVEVKYIEVPKVQIVEKETIKEVPVIVEKEKIIYINNPQQQTQLQP